MVASDATRILVSGTEEDGGYTFMCRKKGDEDGERFECKEKDDEEDAGAEMVCCALAHFHRQVDQRCTGA